METMTVCSVESSADLRVVEQSDVAVAALERADHLQVICSQLGALALLAGGRIHFAGGRIHFAADDDADAAGFK